MARLGFVRVHARRERVILCSSDGRNRWAISCLLNAHTLILRVPSLGGLCSYPGTSQVAPVACARPSVGSRVGRGAVNGLRYMFGVPPSPGMSILWPLGRVLPSTGIQMLQDLHDQKLPDRAPQGWRHPRLNPGCPPLGQRTPRGTGTAAASSTDPRPAPPPST